MIIIFKDIKTYNELIKKLPTLKSGVSLFQPDVNNNNLISPAISTDGRCAVSALFTNKDIEEMLSVWTEAITEKTITFLPAMPSDWGVSLDNTTR